MADTSAEREAKIRAWFASPDRWLVEHRVVADLLAMLDLERAEHAKTERDRADCEEDREQGLSQIRLAIARAERAEAQLAALRMAADRIATIAVIPYNDKGNKASTAYNDAIRDTAAAAEAYTRRVRDETAAMYRESARLAEVERERLTVCRRCGDAVTPGTMNARGVLHTAAGVECGTCVDDGGYERP